MVNKYELVQIETTRYVYVLRNSIITFYVFSNAQILYMITSLVQLCFNNK